MKRWTSVHILVAQAHLDLGIGVSRGLLISSLVVGSFDEFALLERGAGSDDSDQVRRVHSAPAGLC